MVKAILNGTKTMTRRVVKLPIMDRNGTGCELGGSELSRRDLDMYCPHGKPGDRLWVRESHAWADELVDGVKREDPINVAYRADAKILCHEKDNVRDVSDPTWNLEHPCVKWRPSIHLPRWASRITLEITSVRVERVQDISESDAKAEGRHAAMIQTHRQGFVNLWDSINRARGFGWGTNCYVWVLTTFKVI